MPFYRKPKTFTPLLIAAEKKAVKNGLHHAIFTSRFDRYVGDWKQDLKEGKGLFKTVTGKLYEGDWHLGFRHGFGALSKLQENGTYSLEYRGEWVRGKPEGMGWWYYDNGDVYFGYFRKGQRHGYGKMWYKDGTFYVGYWNMSLREGLGMFVQVNGNRYEGHWENNVKSGIGRFYHMHTGQLQEGCWVDDICVKSKMSDIIIRQFCDLPTEYPIPPERLQDAKKILEMSELWLQQKIGEIDKQLKYCIDQMY
ncbi:MORN repeat-containing protein 3-like isoform X1 [Plodia interpunctella]|uniref:MORN repeat-containing protein 3-like isoform X1 n=1 Tax=Plodia interpunctella TaxID=58824 RepID=UPI002368D8E8|nr:MORN repeat-containing protein 3-like isoform X1 [Plodia interpunctella]